LIGELGTVQHVANALSLLVGEPARGRRAWRGRRRRRCWATRPIERRATQEVSEITGSWGDDVRDLAVADAVIRESEETSPGWIDRIGMELMVGRHERGTSWGSRAGFGADAEAGRHSFRDA
jgi:hypothetical protein